MIHKKKCPYAKRSETFCAFCCYILHDELRCAKFNFYLTKHVHKRMVDHEKDCPFCIHTLGHVTMGK